MAAVIDRDTFCNACLMGYCEHCWIEQEGLPCTCPWHVRVAD